MSLAQSIHNLLKLYQRDMNAPAKEAESFAYEAAKWCIESLIDNLEDMPLNERLAFYSEFNSLVKGLESFNSEWMQVRDNGTLQ